MRLSEQELSDAWSQIEASRKAKVQRRARLRGAAAALAGCAVALSGFWLWPRSSGELLASDGRAFHHLAAAQTVRLADDSRIVTTEAGAVEVLENSKAKLSLHLLSGAARFEVTPGTGRHWSVEAGEISVEVTGTIFTVERSAAGARVQVERGTVVVRGARVPDGVKRLTAGEELAIGAVAVAPPVEPIVPQPLIPPTPTPPPAQKVVVAAPPPSSPAEPTAASLMEHADQLRREGHDAEALAVLSSVTERWPRSAEAPLAAVTAANLLQDSGDTEAAKRWYQRALDLGLSGPLADTARRALEAGPRR